MRRFGFLLGEAAVVGAEQTSDVGEGVFLGRESAAVGEREHLLCDLFGGPSGVTGLLLFNEPRIFGETAGIEIEGEIVAAGDLTNRFDVGERNGLAAAGVIGDGDHDQGDVSRAFGFDQALQRRDIHVAFEGNLKLRVASRGQRQVDGFCAAKLDVGTRSVEVGVVGDDVSGFAEDSKENPLGGAALMGGDDIAEAHEIVNGGFETVETFATGVGFVAAHHGGPLLGRHGAGAGVGEKVDENVDGAELEEVVAGIFEQLLTLFGGGAA